MSLNILSYETFSFLELLCFLFAILCKSKLQFLILSRNSTVHLYCATPVLNVNVKAFKLYTELRKLNNFYLVVCTYIFILLPKLWKCCTKWTQLFFLHFFIYTHSINMPLSVYWWIRKDWRERKYGLSYCFFSFHIITFNVNGWLTHGSNMNKKSYNTVPQPCLLSVLYFGRKCWWNRKLDF